MLHPKSLPLLLALALFTACTGHPSQYSNKIEAIELSYVGWACDCAEWARPEDIKRYHDNPGDTLAGLSIFIEADKPENKIPEALKNPCCGNKIRFTGQFYVDEGISKDYERENQKPERVKVFRYTGYEIVKPYTAWVFGDTTAAEPKTVIIK